MGPCGRALVSETVACASRAELALPEASVAARPLSLLVYSMLDVAGPRLVRSLCLLGLSMRVLCAAAPRHPVPFCFTAAGLESEILPPSSCVCGSLGRSVGGAWH